MANKTHIIGKEKRLPMFEVIVKEKYYLEIQGVLNTVPIPHSLNEMNYIDVLKKVEKLKVKIKDSKYSTIKYKKGKRKITLCHKNKNWYITGIEGQGEDCLNLQSRSRKK